MNRGIFITFEGTEAAGKSTQIRLLRSYLKRRGVEPVVTREPGGTKIGNKIRRILLSQESAGLTARAEALLYAASRAQLVEEVIEPALKAGRTVICDRYLDSSLAYQSFGRSLGLEEITGFNRWATEGLIPDLTFWLALKPEKASLRKELKDRIEKEDILFHNQVYRGYEELYKLYPERIIKLDASLSKTKLNKMIVLKLEERGFMDE